MTKVGISAAAFRLPSHCISVEDIWRATPPPENARSNLQIPKLRNIRFTEVQSVPAFNGEPEGALALAAIQEVLDAGGAAAEDVGLLIDYSTVSRASNGLSLCYKLQNQLAANDAFALAIGNGSCSALQIALQTAVALMKHQDIRFAVLFAEDRVRGTRLNFPANVLGDGSSALLLESESTRSRIGGTALISMGRFCDILGINHADQDNFDAEQFENSIVPLHYKAIHDLAARLFKQHGLSIADIDLVLYQNMSLNDFQGLAFTLGVPISKLWTEGLRGRGHIFGSDLVINLRLAQDAGKLPPGSRALMISSGAGFSWGATLLEL